MRSACGLILLLFALSSPAGANPDAHYQDVLIGERASGMGGAFTALADEASGAYYNPAGIAVADSDLIQLQMNAYSLKQRTVFVADLCGQNLESDQGRYFSFPASLGYVKLFDGGALRHGLGLSLSIPSAEKFSSSGTGQNIDCEAAELDFGISEVRTDRVFNGAFSYAIRLRPWLWLGTSWNVNVRGLSSTSIVGLVERPAGTSNSVLASYGSAIEYTIWSTYFQLGAIVEPIESLRIGLNLSTPQIRMAGQGKLVDATGFTQLDANDPLPQGALEVVLDEEASFYWKVPLGLSLGVAYHRPAAFTLAADVRLHLPVEEYALVESVELDPTFAPTQERKLVVNANVGGEVVLGSFELRAGFFTNFTSVPEASLRDGLVDQRIDLFGATIGASFHPNEVSTISASLQGQYGRGEVVGTRLSPENLGGAELVADLTETSVTLFFGGRYDLR